MSLNMCRESNTYQFISPKPSSTIGANTDCVFSCIMGCKGEAALGSIVPRHHGLISWVLDL